MEGSQTIVKGEIGLTVGDEVKDGVVVLPRDVHLPEGAEVEVVLRESLETDPFLDAVKATAKRRPHWPEDYALNHGHYVSGEPKKP